MCRDMGGVKFEWPIQSKPDWLKFQEAPGAGAWRCNAMSQLANWLLSLAVDVERARDATYPASADSPRGAAHRGGGRCRAHSVGWMRHYAHKDGLSDTGPLSPICWTAWQR